MTGLIYDWLSMNTTYEIPAYRDKKVAYSQTNQTYSYFLLLSGSRCWTRRRKSVIGSVNWRPRLLKDWKKIKKPTTELLRYTCVSTATKFISCSRAYILSYFLVFYECSCARRQFPVVVVGFLPPLSTPLASSRFPFTKSRKLRMTLLQFSGG